jgi:hypothetical protein
LKTMKKKIEGACRITHAPSIRNSATQLLGDPGYFLRTIPSRQAYTAA